MKKYKQLSYILSSPPCISIWDTQEDNGGHKESTQVGRVRPKKKQERKSAKNYKKARQIFSVWNYKGGIKTHFNVRLSKNILEETDLIWLQKEPHLICILMAPQRIFFFTIFL